MRVRPDCGSVSCSTLIGHSSVEMARQLRPLIMQDHAVPIPVIVLKEDRNAFARLLEHVTRCMLTRMLKAGTVGAPSDDLGRKGSAGMAQSRPY